jgi:hypothetical protein
LRQEMMIQRPDYMSNNNNNRNNRNNKRKEDFNLH